MVIRLWAFIVKFIPYARHISHNPPLALRPRFYSPSTTQLATQSSQVKAKQQMSYGTSGHQLPTSLGFLSLCLAPSDFMLLSFPLAVTFVSYPVDPASSAAMLEAGSHLS